MSFIPLHVHTEYSLLDGMSTVNEISEAASKNGFPGIAITDHGTMMGVKEFHRELKRKGIRPIIGDEIYITNHYDHRLKDDEHKRSFHLILLAKNLIGYKNLCKIASIGATDGLYRNKPRVCHEVVKQYSEGLICLSACIGGEIPQCILDEDIEGAKEMIGWYKGVFDEDFYLEVCMHPNSRPGNPQNVYQMQKQVCDELFRLGSEMGVKVVATNDSHFTYRSQAFAHDVMLAINCGKKVADTDRLHYTGEEYLKNEAEMLAVFPEHPEAISNTIEIFNKVEDYDLENPIQCPLPYTPKTGESAFDILQTHAYEGFLKLFSPDYQEGRERLEKELTIIRSKGFENYFLLMEDIVNFAKKEGIAYGPGRGFAASSLVNYCLGITKMNPLTHGLLFERMLNDKTVTFTGVDIDFEREASAKMVSYLKEKYGDKSVAGLVSLCAKGTKRLFSEVCDALEVKQATREVLKDILPEDNQIYVYQGNGEYDNYKLTCRNLKEYVQGVSEALKSSEELRKVFEMVSLLEDRKYCREASFCAVMVSDHDLSDTLPVMLGYNPVSKSDDHICQYEKYNSEDVGVLRLNFLELNAISVIKDSVSDIESKYEHHLHLDEFTSDIDTDTLMHLGDTDGVFMFESAGMKKYLTQFRKTPKFENLVALNALYRPGPMDKIPEYIRAINNPTESKKWGIAELDSVLEETGGVLIYQEQVIKFFREFLHKSGTESVRAYKCFAMRKTNQLVELKKEFLDEGCRCGIKERILVKAWNALYNDCLYAFNKAHSVCYVSIAYQCAYLKTHYREIYMKNWERYNND